jgi:hypothetical protein
MNFIEQNPALQDRERLKRLLMESILTTMALEDQSVSSEFVESLVERQLDKLGESYPFLRASRTQQTVAHQDA